ncbi:hypothetical protein VT25_15395 [Photobacterium leiognathi subsp. mandapamensis]|nr:hypothetical protein VT25_15395 [Photobacterium leiognathi subsp. mandapamensis]
MDKHPRLKRWWESYTHFEKQCEVHALWIWSGWRGITLFALLFVVAIIDAAVILFSDTNTVVMVPLLVMCLTLLLHMRTIYRRVLKIKGWRARLRAWFITQLVGDKQHSWQRGLDDFTTANSALVRWFAGLLLTFAMLTLAWEIYQTIAQYSSLNDTLRDALFSLSPVSMMLFVLYFMFEDTLIFNGEIDDVLFDVTLKRGEGEANVTTPMGTLSGYSNDESSGIQGESAHGHSVDAKVSNSTIEVNAERAGEDGKSADPAPKASTLAEPLDTEQKNSMANHAANAPIRHHNLPSR